MRLPRPHLAVLVACALGALGAPCGFQTILIDEPRETLIDESVEVAARVGTNFTLSSVGVWVDGVDLIDAFGLAPPFFDFSGALSIGPDLVMISGFTFDTSPDPRRIALSVAGLSAGPHEVEVEGVKAGSGQPLSRVASFEIVGGFSQAAWVMPSAARAEPAISGPEGELAGATTGDPLAAPRVGLSGGGELRSGFVEAAEGLIAGGIP